MGYFPFCPRHQLLPVNRLHRFVSTIDLRRIVIDELAPMGSDPRDEQRFIRFVPLSTKNTAVM
jgi:hypothetical protein